MRSVLFLSVFLSCVAGLSPAQDARTLTVDDELDRVEPSQTAIAPDGSSVVYVQSELNWEKNKRETHLVRVSSSGSIAFTRGLADRAPAWSADGRHVAFLRKTEKEEDKADQIWVIPSAGGEAYPLTELSEGVLRFVWAPDGSTIAFVAKDPMDKEAKKRMKDGDDAIFVFEGPNGQGRDRWSNIWVVDLDERKPRQVTHEKMLVSDLDVSPDGEHVAFVFRRDNARNNGNLAELAMARVEGGAMVRLTENEAPESKIRFSPDGRSLGYLAPDGIGWELRQRKLYLMDIETRNGRVASTGFEGDIRDFRFFGDRIHLVAGVRTENGVFSLDSETKQVDPLFQQAGIARDVSFSGDGDTAAFVWSRADAPPEVGRVELGRNAAPELLTDLNPHFRELRLSSVELLRWKSRDGLDIEGLLYLPPGAVKGEPVPLILEIHGGPAGVFTRSWRGDRHIYGGLGYAILAPNVRGSTAYGDDLLRGNMNDIGGGDFDDLMTGVDYVIEQKIADPDHLGVRGWSYGGILGGWVVTHTDRFKAASLGAMVSDWRSEYGQGFNHDVRLWYIGGDPWTNPEGYRERSPLTHVQNVTTPTLLLHGEADTVDTIEQTMNFHNALWEKGTPTRFIRFPRQGHGIREPRHLRVRMVEEIAWMQKYIHGIEWTHPERVTEETLTTDNP